MTAAQKTTRKARERRLGRPERGIRVRRVVEMLGQILPLIPAASRVRLDTDEEPDYARGVRQLSDSSKVSHVTTSSRRRRGYDNPLWRINHVHRLMRHSLANVKRETIAHSKTLAGFMDRMLVFLGWLNLTKGVSERRKSDAETTPAMLLRLESRSLSGAELWGKRRFPGRIPVPKSLKCLYDGSLKSRPGESVAARRPKFAF